jgi:hypothetical protein
MSGTNFPRSRRHILQGQNPLNQCFFFFGNFKKSWSGAKQKWIIRQRCLSRLTTCRSTCWHNAQLTLSCHLNMTAVSVKFRYVRRAASKFTVQTRQHIRFRDVMGAAGLQTSFISFWIYNTSPCYVAMQKWDSKLVDTPHSNIRSHNTRDYVTLTASRGSNCIVLSSFKKIWKSEMPVRPSTFGASQIPRWYFLYRLKVPEWKEEFVRRKLRRGLCFSCANCAGPTSLLSTEYECKGNDVKIYHYLTKCYSHKDRKCLNRRADTLFGGKQHNPCYCWIMNPGLSV